MVDGLFRNGKSPRCIVNIITKGVIGEHAQGQTKMFFFVIKLLVVNFETLIIYKKSAPRIFLDSVIQCFMKHETFVLIHET